MDSLWVAILPLLLMKIYRAIWYSKSTLTSSAEKIALASVETKKEKCIGLDKNIAKQILAKYIAKISLLLLENAWCFVGLSCGQEVLCVHELGC